MFLNVQVFIMLLILQQSQACSNDNRLIFSDDYSEDVAPNLPKTNVLNIRNLHGHSLEALKPKVQSTNELEAFFSVPDVSFDPESRIT